MPIETLKLSFILIGNGFTLAVTFSDSLGMQELRISLKGSKQSYVSTPSWVMATISPVRKLQMICSKTRAF